MKNILMSLVLTATLVLSACTGCKKERHEAAQTEVAAPTMETHESTPAAPVASEPADTK